MDQLDEEAVNLTSALRAAAATGAITASLLAAHAALNMRLVRRPANTPHRVEERVSVLVPARDEATRIAATLRCLMAQEGLSNVEFVILDDDSRDGTADVVREIAGDDRRIRLISGGDAPLPTGWLGKSWACHRLAQQATGTVLVFIDADVHLTPHAIASTIAQMRSANVDLLSPYPRQLAVGVLERITQPMVTWSWITALPVRLTESRPYPSMAAAVGQFLVVDARAYRISGGHAAVSDMILEDVGILRALKHAGFRGAPADGSEVAECRMYTSGSEIVEGYTKSVWSAFQSPLAAYAVVGVMALTYLAPPVFAVCGPDAKTRRWGLIGYGAGVAGRYAVARRTGERIWPDIWAQPISVGAFAGLIVASLQRHRAGTLTWRGRPLP